MRDGEFHDRAGDSAHDRVQRDAAVDLEVVTVDPGLEVIGAVGRLVQVRLEDPAGEAVLTSHLDHRPVRTTVPPGQADLGIAVHVDVDGPLHQLECIGPEPEELAVVGRFVRHRLPPSTASGSDVTQP